MKKVNMKPELRKYLKEVTGELCLNMGINNRWLELAGEHTINAEEFMHRLSTVDEIIDDKEWCNAIYSIIGGITRPCTSDKTSWNTYKTLQIIKHILSEKLGEEVELYETWFYNKYQFRTKDGSIYSINSVKSIDSCACATFVQINDKYCPFPADIDDMIDALIETKSQFIKRNYLEMVLLKSRFQYFDDIKL